VVILSSMPSPRAVGASAWRVVLPDARLTLVQIGIGIVDLVAGSLATYVLLPEAPSTDYAVVAAAYVVAALLSFLSHALGSLGVFEVAMLVMRSQYQKEELLASLLILHFLYYLLPLAKALLMLGVREKGVAAARASRQAASDQPSDDMSIWKTSSSRARACRPARQPAVPQAKCVERCRILAATPGLGVSTGAI
jgi:CBS domain containing-hemolysin-like protein